MKPSNTYSGMTAEQIMATAFIGLTKAGQWLVFVKINDQALIATLFFHDSAPGQPLIELRHAGGVAAVLIAEHPETNLNLSYLQDAIQNAHYSS